MTSPWVPFAGPPASPFADVPIAIPGYDEPVIGMEILGPNRGFELGVFDGDWLTFNAVLNSAGGAGGTGSWLTTLHGIPSHGLYPYPPGPGYVMMPVANLQVGQPYLFQFRCAALDDTAHPIYAALLNLLPGFDLGDPVLPATVGVWGEVRRFFVPTSDSGHVVAYVDQPADVGIAFNVDDYSLLHLNTDWDGVLPPGSTWS